MKNIDQLPFGFSLPMLSDEVAVEIHNFLQICECAVRFTHTTRECLLRFNMWTGTVNRLMGPHLLSPLCRAH